MCSVLKSVGIGNRRKIERKESYKEGLFNQRRQALRTKGSMGGGEGCSRGVPTELGNQVHYLLVVCDRGPVIQPLSAP